MIYKNLTQQQYIELEGINQSALQNLYRGTKYFDYKINNNIPTKEMIFGTQVDEYVLTPKFFKEKYFILAEKIDKRTKEGKKKSEELEETLKNECKTLITQDELDILKNVHASLMSHKWSAKFLRKFQPQICYDFSVEDEKENWCIDCKCRIDGLIETKKEPIIFDLKTTSDATFDGFTKKIFTYGYHIQAAFYLDGYYKNTGKHAKYYIIAIENKEPFQVAVYELSEDNGLINIGRTEYLNLIRKYRDMVFNKEQNDLNNNKILKIEVPKWYSNKIYSNSFIY